MQDRIEQEVTIEAGLDRVWDLVTEPGWWVPSDTGVAIDRAPGSRTVRESRKWGRFPVEVLRIEPRTYAAFRWASRFPGAELTEGNTTMVEFFVAAAEGGVTVTVRESGFARLDAAEDVREAALRANTEGWRQEMADLSARARS
jgi:uncharacterized protein YndB with AHSA1/START domain